LSRALEVGSSQVAVVERACDLIRRNPERKVTLATLSGEVGVSPFHLQRLFKRVMGITPRRYLEECRLARLKERLREGEPVSRAIYSSGYNSSSWLYGDSTGKLGMTPATYRRGGPGTRVSYTVGESPIGRVLVAATEKGICAVILGAGDLELAAALRREYPKAAISRADEDMEHVIRGVLGYLEGQQASLPLDVRGTEFQRKVWAALRTIPYGSTCSYSEVAAVIGRPAATRAVANACAANPVPLIVPCHRVVRKDGGVGGYRYGVETKEALLSRERKLAARRPRMAGV
jgi:AraC family transcriptional regulator, regulatory protein of adaptative response / methylated-DNA-[protein]-cysteine methyltransferase